LFEIGLNETHFDLLVARHLVAALQQMSVAQTLIDEVLQCLVPFRKVFERIGREEKIMDYMVNARHHKMQRQREREQENNKVLSPRKGTVMKDQDKRHRHSFPGSSVLGVMRRRCSLGSL
jgi:hypothetical protein